MNKLRLVVHLGLDRNNEVQCYAVQMCGQLIPFGGSFELRERYLIPSYWIWGSPWSGSYDLKEWKEHSKRGHGVVRFQRVTYTADSIKKGVR